LKEFSQAHLEPKSFIEDLMETIRNTLMVKISSNVLEVLDLPDAEIEELEKLGDHLSEEDLHWQFDMALKGAQDLTRGSDTRLILEMILLRMATAPRFLELSQGASHSHKPIVKPPPRATSFPNQQKMVQNAATHDMISQVTESSPVVKAVEPSGENVPDEWREFVEKVKGVNGLVGAQLENCYLKKMEAKKLTLAVPGKLKFIYEKVNHPDFKKKLSNYLTTFWGPGFEVEIQLGDLDSETAPTPKTLSSQKQSVAEAKEKELIENHPLVQSAKNTFKAEIKAIKNMKGDTP
jgi:DNA polymerase III subunit gamma/tau